MTVAEVQSQVQLLTHHDNLDSYVVDWLNRTLQDLGTTALWNKQTRSVVAFHPTITAAPITPSSQIFNVVPGANELIEFVGMRAGYWHATSPTQWRNDRSMVRRDWGGLVARLHGGTVTGTNRASDAYAAVSGSVLTYGRTVSQYMLGFPLAASGSYSTYAACSVDYLESPAKVSLSTDTNWLMAKYPRVVLAGVMMRARLFLRDGRGYLMEKSEYVNGIADMLLMEENITANKPYLRAVQSDEVNRRLP